MPMRPDAVDNLQYLWVMAGQDASPYLPQIDAAIQRMGWTPLNGKTSNVLVALDGEKVVGFHVPQLFPHAEPLFVDPGWQGTGLANELSGRMLDFLMSVNARGFMVIADSPHAEKLCQKFGMKRVTSPVYIM